MREKAQPVLREAAKATSKVRALSKSRDFGNRWHKNTGIQVCSFHLPCWRALIVMADELEAYEIAISAARE